MAAGLRSRGAGLIDPHPEEPALAGVSKDVATARASWFETRCFAMLLTMRAEVCVPRSSPLAPCQHVEAEVTHDPEQQQGLEHQRDGRRGRSTIAAVVRHEDDA